MTLATFNEKKEFFTNFFNHIQHGGKEHREWLRDEIISFAKEHGEVTLEPEDFEIKWDGKPKVVPGR
jgi:hypothetical protein